MGDGLQNFTAFCKHAKWFDYVLLCHFEKPGECLLSPVHTFTFVVRYDTDERLYDTNVLIVLSDPHCARSLLQEILLSFRTRTPAKPTRYKFTWFVSL